MSEETGKIGEITEPHHHEEQEENPYPTGLKNTEEIIEFNGQKVNTAIFTQGFVAGCDMKICFGECCKSGVYMDKNFPEVILAHKDMIKGVMSADQIKDESKWFDDEIVEDEDFPSGYAAGSNVYTDSKGVEKCVFNDENQYCSLQVAAVANGMHKWAIKPTYCIMYPVAVVNHILTYDDEHSQDLAYCGIDKEHNFTQTTFDGTREEIKYVLGEELYNSLDEHYKQNYTPKYNIKLPETK